MSELTITSIYVLAIRNVALVTGELRSGQLAAGSELRRNDKSRIPILAIEFKMPNATEGHVTIVVPISAATALRVGEKLHSEP